MRKCGVDDGEILQLKVMIEDADSHMLLNFNECEGNSNEKDGQNYECQKNDLMKVVVACSCSTKSNITIYFQCIKTSISLANGRTRSNDPVNRSITSWIPTNFIRYLETHRKHYENTYAAELECEYIVSVRICNLRII